MDTRGTSCGPSLDTRRADTDGYNYLHKHRPPANPKDAFASHGCDWRSQFQPVRLFRLIFRRGESRARGEYCMLCHKVQRKRRVRDRTNSNPESPALPKSGDKTVSTGDIKHVGCSAWCVASSEFVRSHRHHDISPGHACAGPAPDENQLRPRPSRLCL